MQSNTVHLFFSCDDSYVPYLAVTLESLKENCDRSREYEIRVLNTGIREDYKEKILTRYRETGFNIEFFDISASIEKISDMFHTRDYYSKTTYYRLFIPQAFPELDKALYLDVDLTLLGDISKLYDTELGDAIVGAVTDGFVESVDVLREYVIKHIGMRSAEDYFNAGVLLMNLREMRKMNFEDVFLRLIAAVKFDVAQDQDYLNVISNGRRKSIGYEWNCMPGYEKNDVPPQLIHFNLHNKPWHTNGVAHSDEFWSYARRTPFIEEIEEEKKNYSSAQKRRARMETKALCELANEKANDTVGNLKIKADIEKILNT